MHAEPNGSRRVAPTFQNFSTTAGTTPKRKAIIPTKQLDMDILQKASVKWDRRQIGGTRRKPSQSPSDLLSAVQWGCRLFPGAVRNHGARGTAFPDASLGGHGVVAPIPSELEDFVGNLAPDLLRNTSPSWRRRSHSPGLSTPPSRSNSAAPLMQVSQALVPCATRRHGARATSHNCGVMHPRRDNRPQSSRLAMLHPPTDRPTDGLRKMAIPFTKVNTQDAITKVWILLRDRTNPATYQSHGRHPRIPSSEDRAVPFT